MANTPSNMLALGTKAPFLNFQIHLKAMKFNLRRFERRKRNFGDFYVQSLSVCIACN
jgi:hypothetical protein